MVLLLVVLRKVVDICPLGRRRSRRPRWNVGGGIRIDVYDNRAPKAMVIVTVGVTIARLGIRKVDVDGRWFQFNIAQVACV